MVDKTQEYGEKLRNLLDQYDMTQRDLSKALHLTDGAVGNYVSGRRLPRYEITVQIAKMFNVTADYLLGIDTSKNEEFFNENVIEIPVFSDIKYSDNLSLDNPAIIRKLSVASKRYPKHNRLFAKVINTDEMSPRIMINDVVIFEEFNLGIDTIFNGDICLVSTGDETAVVREMATKDNVYCFNLMNVTMPPHMYTISEMRKDNINIIGRAVTLIHDFPKRG